MGGEGSGRPTKEASIVKSMYQGQHPIATTGEKEGEFFLPNYSASLKLDQKVPQTINTGNNTSLLFTNYLLNGDYYPVIATTTSSGGSGLGTEYLFTKYIAFVDDDDNVNILSLGEDGLITIGGISATNENVDVDTGLKEVCVLKGHFFGGGSVGDETSIIFRDGAGNGILSGNRRLGAVSGVIDKKESGSGTNDWEGGIIINIFEGGTYPTPQEVMHFYADKSVKFFGGIKTSDGSTGFTGTGAYTNFTIKNGIITAAS